MKSNEEQEYWQKHEDLLGDGSAAVELASERINSLSGDGNLQDALAFETIWRDLTRGLTRVLTGVEAQQLIPPLFE